MIQFRRGQVATATGLQCLLGHGFGHDFHHHSHHHFHTHFHAPSPSLPPALQCPQRRPGLARGRLGPDCAGPVRPQPIHPRQYRRAGVDPRPSDWSEPIKSSQHPVKLQLDATKILRNCSSVESLQYLQTILVKLINPTLRVVGFSSAQNLKTEKNMCANDHPFPPIFHSAQRRP